MLFYSYFKTLVGKEVSTKPQARPRSAARIYHNTAATRALIAAFQQLIIAAAAAAAAVTPPDVPSQPDPQTPSC